MYGKEASNRKQEIDRQHYTIPNQRNQRSKDKHDEIPLSFLYVKKIFRCFPFPIDTYFP